MEKKSGRKDTCQLIEDENINFADADIYKIIMSHLENLIAEFDRFILEGDIFKYNWVRCYLIFM